MSEVLEIKVCVNRAEYSMDHSIISENYFYHLNISINPCPAGPGYIRFQKSFNPNKMPLKLIKYSVVDAQLIKYFNSGDVYFS